MGTQRHIMVALVLLSILTSLVSAAPLPAAHWGLLPSPGVNATATANLPAEMASSRSHISEYLTSTFLRTLSTVRRCGGRRECGSRISKGSPPSPPAPPPPPQIAQTVMLRSKRLLLEDASDYAGMYKLVVEAGWGISIGIYDETGPGWKHGVNTTSSASDACNENWCGIEVLFRASVPSHLSHHAESLSASAFCSGVASAKEAMARGSSIALFNETDVTITTVHAHEEGENLIGVWIALGVVGVLVCCFCSCACGEGGGPRE